MSRTMEQFKNLIIEINKLREEQEWLIESFEKSNCELSEVFHWIVKTALEDRNSCALSVDTCPPLYAKALQGMGFNVVENRNCFNTLCGYTICWE